MRHYTDLEDFANGVKKLAKQYKDIKQMPVLLSVNGMLAPFGICVERNVYDVPCVVLTGCTEAMANVNAKNRDEQIRYVESECVAPSAEERSVIRSLLERMSPKRKDQS